MSKKTKILLLALVFLAVVVWANIAKSPADQNVNQVGLHILDVGQGDAVLVEKGDYQLLIDGGPDDKVLTQLGKVMPSYDRKIEGIILTHPHADHMRGLISVLDRYEVGRVLYTGSSYESNGYKEFLDKIKQKNIPLSIPEINSKEVLFEGGEITYLWPGKQYENKTEANLNNTSGVAKFCYLLQCVLLTGDIEVDEQKKMFEYYSLNISPPNNILSADLLKLAHHGSSNGTNEELLNIVKPKEVAVSLGADNKYGHPHEVVINLLQNKNIKYYRTDQEGTIHFSFTQEGIIKK